MRLTAIVRILTGILFVAEGLSKVTGDFVTGEFAKEVPQIAARSFPFWRHFLESVVAPHAALFAWAVALGELAVGLGLIAGLLTRVAAGERRAAHAVDHARGGEAGGRRDVGRLDHRRPDLEVRLSAPARALRRGCRQGLGLRRPAAQGAARKSRLTYLSRGWRIFSSSAYDCFPDNARSFLPSVP